MVIEKTSVRVARSSPAISVRCATFVIVYTRLGLFKAYCHNYE